MESILPDAVRGRLEEAEDVAAILMWLCVTTNVDAQYFFFLARKIPFFRLETFYRQSPVSPEYYVSVRNAAFT